MNATLGVFSSNRRTFEDSSASKSEATPAGTREGRPKEGSPGGYTNEVVDEEEEEEEEGEGEGSAEAPNARSASAGAGDVAAWPATRSAESAATATPRPPRGETRAEDAASASSGGWAKPRASAARRRVRDGRGLLTRSEETARGRAGGDRAPRPEGAHHPLAPGAAGRTRARERRVIARKAAEAEGIDAKRARRSGPAPRAPFGSSEKIDDDTPRFSRPASSGPDL
jgi:hypothetical protein